MAARSGDFGRGRAEVQNRAPRYLQPLDAPFDRARSGGGLQASSGGENRMRRGWQTARLSSVDGELLGQPGIEGEEK